MVTVTGVGYSGAADVTGFLPLISPPTVYNYQASLLLYRPLLWIDENVALDFERSIAERIDVSEDNRIFTVHLKPDFRWSNGRPVEAADVLYGYELIEKLGKAYSAYGMGGIPTLIERIEALDPHTLQVTVSRPVNPIWFQMNGLTQLYPLPSREWKGHDLETLRRNQLNPDFLQPINGPFRLSEYKMGRYARFERNPDYSGHRAHLDTFIFRFFASGTGNTQFSALKTGTLDMGNLSFLLWGARHMLDHLKSLDTQGGFGYYALSLNYANPGNAFAKDVRLRRALQLAIDQQSIIDVLAKGRGHVAYQPVPYQPPTYLSASSRRHGEEIRLYDPEAARRLLSEAGWQPGADGMRVKAGERLTFEVLVSPGSLIAQLIQSQLRRVGIDMTLRQLPFNQVMARIYGQPQSWQAYLGGWIYNPDFFPSGDSLFDTGGGNNQMQFSDAKMDRLIEATTREEGLQALYRYQDYHTEIQPVIFIPNTGGLVKHHPKLRGVRRYLNPTGSISPEYLWWED